jgi:hypothetical protein
MLDRRGMLIGEEKVFGACILVIRPLLTSGKSSMGSEGRLRDGHAMNKKAAGDNTQDESIIPKGTTLLFPGKERRTCPRTDKYQSRKKNTDQKLAERVTTPRIPKWKS